jgi:putative acyl-CoA dehydrogenase
MPATHTVLNQPPALGAHDAYAEDVALREAVRREGAGWSEDGLGEVGRLVGDPAWVERGRLANEHRPVLESHDRYGHRIDRVVYHPTYHELMAAGVRVGLHGAPWAEPQPGAHVARAGRYVLWPRVDSGTLCPLTMTYAVVPSLRHQPDVAGPWEDKALSSTYDATEGPVAAKRGALFGMAMTEKQGGSDVRANTSVAVPIEAVGPGQAYRITGHKWFCSAPMNDAFLVLAKVDDAPTPSCFLVPRWLPDGTRNTFLIQRLKDKVGDRSNASSEIEFEDTVGWMIGEPHRGVRVIMEMVAHTRLDCVSGAAGWLRAGLVEATWHTVHRAAFGRRLVEQPLMRNVLADLAIESEAATALALRLARAFDQAELDTHEASIQRIGTPVAKYWTCKRAPMYVAEAMECLGGGGYVEDSGMPLLYRQAPVNGIWEGSGNVQCLDALRAMHRSPESVEAYLAEVTPAGDADTRLGRAVEQLRTQLVTVDERSARRVVERMALVWQAALLVRDGDPAVADAFVASRIAGDGGLAFGTLPDGLDEDTIIARIAPWAA